jgi:uncharacterized protein
VSDPAREAWARTRVHVWPGDYLLASLPCDRMAEAAALAAEAPAGTFAALVRERDEVALTLPDALRGRLQALGARADGPYRVLTFDVTLALDLVGFLAPAAARLAEAGVSIVPQCGFRTDHLLVRAEDLEAARRVLDAFVREAAAGG